MVEDDTPDDLSDNGPVPVYAAVLAELKLMKESLARLEDEALRLMAQAGVKQGEIGDEMGITGQAVGKRLRRPRESGPLPPPFGDKPRQRRRSR